MVGVARLWESNPNRALQDIALAPMIEATAAGAFDAVLHSGDCAWGAEGVRGDAAPPRSFRRAAVAYDLEDNGGVNGNVYMNGVQPIASQASVPRAAT